MKNSLKFAVIAIAVATSFSTFAAVFDDAVSHRAVMQSNFNSALSSAQRANKIAALADSHYNTERSSTDMSINDSLAHAADVADRNAANANVAFHRAYNKEQAADAAVNGINYRTQVAAMQVAAVKLNATQVAAGSINVSAGSLPANTPVKVQTNDGKITTVAASTLSPAVQVSVPHVDAIINSPSLKGGQQSHDHGHTHNGGQGNGESNAANTNSAHGMGGANHIGGGAAQSGSQNVGHW